MRSHLSCPHVQFKQFQKPTGLLHHDKFFDVIITFLIMTSKWYMIQKAHGPLKSFKLDLWTGQIPACSEVQD